MAFTWEQTLNSFTSNGASHATSRPASPQNGQSFDRIVIGAGGVGSAAAYHLAQAGQRVLLLEQFALGHARGSSHGGSRIIRYSDADPKFARMAPAAFELWRQLEADSGAKLLTPVGSANVGPADNAFVRDATETMALVGYPHRLLTGDERRREFPQFTVPDDWVVLYQANAGILAASLCVQTMAQEAVRHGATLLEQTRVASVQPAGDGVAVHAEGPGGAQTFHADGVVIAAGPWVGRFFNELLPFRVPVQPTHQQVAYFRVTDPALYDRARCPVYMFSSEPHFYGFPIHEKPGHIKIGGELYEPIDDVDQLREIDQGAMAELCDAIAQQMEAVDPTPVGIELCKYTDTPNRDFVIDQHPEHPQIVFGGGFSGRGFKWTIATGHLLAELSTRGKAAHDNPFWHDDFRLARFAEPV